MGLACDRGACRSGGPAVCLLMQACGFEYLRRHTSHLPQPQPARCAQGRVLLWAWLQERRAPGTAATYAGCLSAPRVLALAPDGRRLLQRPAPELARLRRCFWGHPGADANGATPADAGSAAADATGDSDDGALALSPGFSGRGGWYADEAEVEEGQPLAVEGVAGPQLDLELCFRRWAGWGVPVQYCLVAAVVQLVERECPNSMCEGAGLAAGAHRCAAL